MASTIKFYTRSNRYFLLGIILLVPVIGFTNECSVLEYQNKKSSAAQVLVNPCLNDRKIGVGSIFKVQPDGRLWLVSKNDPITDFGQQLICRNKTGKALTISVVSADAPWIQPKGFDSCAGWVDNKLTCNEPDQVSKPLFCAIATIKKAEVSQEIQRTTSVRMRGASKNTASIELDRITDYLKAEINLCRDVYQYQPVITVEWSIQPSGEIQNPRIKEPAVDPGFAECVVDILKSFDFPSFPKRIQASYQF